MVLLEYQAVVLAGGKGSRMTEITARKAKCLLPVGNYPMVWYSLQMLEHFGFQEVIVVVQEAVKSETEAILEDCGLKLRLDVFGIPVNEDWGTADSLRHIADFIKVLDFSSPLRLFSHPAAEAFSLENFMGQTVPQTWRAVLLKIQEAGVFINSSCLESELQEMSDVLVISCDLITSIDLHAVLNAHRKYNATLTAVFFPSQEENFASLPTPGPKSKSKTEQDIVGISNSTSRLLLLASVSDYEEVLPMRKDIIKKHGRIGLHSTLLDAHLYIMKKCLLDFLVQNKSISTVKGELLPHIVKKQFSAQNSLSVESKNKDQMEVIRDSSEKEKESKDIFDFIHPDELSQKIQAMSTFNDHFGDSKPVYHNDILRCYAYIPPSDQYAVRVNTLSQYCSINRQIISRWNELTNKKEMKLISANNEILSTQLDEFTCAVGSYSKVSEKTSIKTTLIGSKCKINPKTRITDSIIMNNVTIGEGCVISNCVIGDDAVLEDGCQLKDCVVGSQHVIHKNAKHSNQSLMDIDRLMEI